MRDEAGQRHRHDPAGGESQKGKAEPRIGKRKVRLDAGNRRRPRANSKAISQKNAERSQPLRPRGRASFVKGKLGTRVDHLDLSGLHRERGTSVVGAAAKVFCFGVYAPDPSAALPPPKAVQKDGRPPPP